MNTDLKEKEKIRDKIKLDKSYNNYHKIIDKKLPYKFSYLDEWLLKKSKILAKESEVLAMILEEPKSSKVPHLRTYKRGTIVKADFGVGIGSEMSQVHFAIVLNNYDNPKNDVLTVVPLTSKRNNYNLYLGALIIDVLVKKVEKEFKPIKDKIKYKKEITLEEKTKLNKLTTLVSYYKSNAKSTYACCNLVTTISKKRIFLPINEYDIVGKTRCTNEVLKMIENDLKIKYDFQNLTSNPK